MAEPPANPGDAVTKGKAALKNMPRWVWIVAAGGGALILFLTMRSRNADAAAVADPATAEEYVPQTAPYAADMYSSMGEPMYTPTPVSYSGNLFNPSIPQPPPESPPAAAAPVQVAQPIINVPPAVGAQPSVVIVGGPAPTGGGPPARPAPAVAHGTVPAGQPSSNQLQEQIRGYNKEAADNRSSNARRKELAGAYNFVAAVLKQRGASIPAPDGNLAKFGAKKP